MTTHQLRTTAVLASAAVIAGLFAGCSSGVNPAGTSAAVVATPPPAGQNAPTQAPPPTTAAPTGVPRGSVAGPPATTRPAPKTTPPVTRSLPSNQISIDGEQVARSAAAAAAATRFMQAFARPDLSEAAWWARIGPLLTASGQQGVYGTDPALIPVTKLTGPALVLPGAEKDARTVTVATDIGEYTLFLLWDEPDQRVAGADRPTPRRREMSPLT